MPQQSRKLRGGVLVLLLTAFAVAAQARVTQEFHKTVPLGSNGGFSLENINGAVHISVWDRNEVQIDAVKSADRQRKLDEAQIEVSSAGSNVKVCTRIPGDQGRVERKVGWNKDNAANVEYTIHVPRRVAFNEISLVNGDLDVDGVTGSIHAESVNGNMRILNAAGGLRAKSVNGHIEASFTNLSAEVVSMETVNGALEVRLPENASAHLHASTVNGGVHCDFAVERSKRGWGGHLEETIGSGATKVELSSVNGSIKISRI
ncbi:MAG TPA: DUF4097 family beta strand repeat-containing protein [Candidatus Acidoferrales bacterium]|nr:DUF4097 family beta strand repeat-containing protein [Candidatus Acidoferrales bacterium]